MKILVVGGKGFIGSEIVKQAHADSEEREIRAHRFDFSAYDLVVIEAAVTAQAEFEKDPKGSFETNVMGLLNVLEGCKKVPKVAFASSAAVYGLTDKPSKETDPINPHNDYAASKAMGELLFRRYRPDGVVLRYFNTYGQGENSKGDYKSIISQFIETIAERGEVVVYGDGEQRRDFVNVKDVARITLELGMKASGTFNVGTGKAVSWNEIIGILRASGLKFHVRYIPNPIPSYQNFTQAEVSKLHSFGLKAEIPLEHGIKDLLNVKYSERES